MEELSDATHDRVTVTPSTKGNGFNDNHTAAVVAAIDRTSDLNSLSASMSSTSSSDGAYQDETPRDAGIERLISSNMRPSESPQVIATTTMELTAHDAYDRDVDIKDDVILEDHIMAVVDTTTATTTTIRPTTTTTTPSPAPELLAVEAVKKKSKVAVRKTKREVVARVKHAASSSLSSSMQLAQELPSDLCSELPTGQPDASDHCTAATTTATAATTSTTVTSAAIAPKATRRKRKATVVPLNSLDDATAAVSEVSPLPTFFPGTTMDEAAAPIPVEAESDSLPVSNTLTGVHPPPVSSSSSSSSVKKRVRRVSSKQKAALESEALLLDYRDGDATVIPAVATIGGATTTTAVKKEKKKLKPSPVSEASYQEPVIVVYSHEVELKMKLHREKMQALVLELGQLER